MYRDSSSIHTAKTQEDSHHVGHGGRAWKWVVGDRDLHGKSSVRDGYFRTSDIPFIIAEHTKMKPEGARNRKLEAWNLLPFACSWSPALIPA